jgi:sugar (glycoside-pentoside-hexuronide) transporter
MEKTSFNRATLPEIVRYSFGGLGSNIPFQLVLMYLTFYYTDVIHINPAAVGVLFLISKAIDALASVLVGMLSDRTKSKLGKFRPWIIYGAPVLGITIFLLFFVPSGLSDSAKLVYIYATFIIYSFASASVNIPYHSLTPVLTDDPDQRTTVTMAKQLQGVFAGLLVTAVALPLVSVFGGGSTGWTLLALTYGAIVTVSFWICASGAKRTDNPEKLIVKENKVKEKVTVGKQLSLIGKNLPLVLLLIAFGFDNAAMALSSAANMYFFNYNLGKVNLVAIMGLVQTVVTVPISFTVPALAKKFGKKNLMLWGYVLATVPLLLLHVVSYSNAYVVIALFVTSAAIFQVTNICGWAALADCVEYGEWKTGLRGEGTVTSSLTFINKVGNALGGMLTGVILASVGYVAGKVQPDIVLEAIKHMRVTAPIIAYVISIVAMYFYVIDNKFFAKMMSDLAERREKSKVTEADDSTSTQE